MRRFSHLFFVISILAGCGANPPDSADTSSLAGRDFDWRASIQLSSVPLAPYTGNDFGSAYYKDIMSHAGRKITRYTPTTNGHETNHMLNNEVRNATPANDNTFYFEQGQAALVIEPAMQASRIKDYVSAFVKGKSSKYQTYLVGQTGSWPNVLYQFDEWGAYRTDARIGMELGIAGTLVDAVDGEICINDGAIEFLYFATAAVHALQLNEPAFLTNNVQFKAAYAMLAEQSLEYYRYGRGNQTLDCDGGTYLDHFVTAPENAAMRATLSAWMGDGWTSRVLGF